MAVKFDTIEKFPQWALSYFINADDSGLDPEDLRQIREWERSNPGIAVVSTVDGTESEFEPYPEFGAACSTVDVTVEVVA